jgi:hypothetical protein
MSASILHAKITKGLLELEQRAQSDSTVSHKYSNKIAPPDSVRPDVASPYSENVSDLEALRLVIRLRKPLCVVEFGSGWSTRVIAEELSLLENANLTLPFNHHRHSAKPFRCFSLDESEYWLSVALGRIPEDKQEFVSGIYSPVVRHYVGETPTLRYGLLPSVKPDLIYLDGPSQFALSDKSLNKQALDTNQPWFPPIASDILQIEWLLEPGATLLVDGRKTNVEFLMANFQRQWEVATFPNLDLTLLSLVSNSLGKSNEEKIQWEISE